jgi:transcriptional regulator GlxA family with amidase domain
VDIEENKMTEGKSQFGCMDDLVIALVLFEGAEEQDVVGPYEMFWWMSLFQHLPPDQPIGESDFLKTFRSREGSTPNIFTVAPNTGMCPMSSGMRFVPHFSYDNAPPANMIVVPGGHGSLNFPALRKNGTTDYVKKIATAQHCKYIMSVCSGAFILGVAGLLDGRQCTCNHTSYGHFESEMPKAKLIRDASLSFVQEGNLFTSNGPCSGLATSLRVVEYHCGTGYKNNLRTLLSYIPPPVKGGLVENGVLKHITV